MKIVYIDRENLHIFWTIWGISTKLSEEIDLIIKVTKKQAFTLFLEITILEKVKTTVKIRSKRKISEIFKFSIPRFSGFQFRV